jgi:D-tyrosyl-tRNA(Tyr) deacylase
MKALLQRVRFARVEIQGKVSGQIDQGLLVFLGVEPQDTPEHTEKLISKILKLRLFEDETGAMGKSVGDIKGGILVVSQFTLMANTKKGTRPSFSNAAAPQMAKEMYADFLVRLKKLHPVVASGEFGADMQVHLTNDGPVTIPIDV